MKNSITVFAIFILFAIQLNAQDVQVPETQKPFIVKISASWCPLCGSWGWDFYENIYDDNREEADFLTVHHSGDYTNPVAGAIADNFNIFGQPRFFLDGVDQNVSSSNTSSKRTEFLNMVDDINSMSPSIQTGLDAHYSGNVLKVDYEVELFNDLDGEYYVAFYLAQKTFVGYQASRGENAQHMNLLRDEMSGNAFGTFLFYDGASYGDTFSGTLSRSLGSYQPDNLQIVSVIWKKSGNEYEYVNSNKDDNVQETNTSSIFESGFSGIKVYPTVTKDVINIELTTSHAKNKVVKRIRLTDMYGKEVLAIKPNERLEQDLIRLYKPAGLPAGVYFLQFERAENIITKEIIFE